MGNIVLFCMIGGCVFFATELLQHPQQEEAEYLAACYGQILGVRTPRVRIVNRIGTRGARGAAPNARVILIHADHVNREVISHEMRHVAQYASGYRFDFRLPYEQRHHERQAFAWSDANQHKC